MLKAINISRAGIIGGMNLEKLNPQQRAAIDHDTGPMLVVAGAGTGKTAVITARIAQLINTGRAKPTEVLALTFTEKAAREMADRLHELIGWASFQVPVLTFNAFGAELLSRFAPHIGRSVRGGLLNETQKTLLLREHIGEVSLSYYGAQADMFEFLLGIVRYIGELQNAGVTPGRYREYVERITASPEERHPLEIAEERDLLLLYEFYETLKERTGSIDFNDQLLIPLKILQQKPNVAVKLSRQYRYILVDEYQDTNAVQDELLRAIVPPGGNLFAVGDDDQAIYGFRGAKVQNILDFAEHFKLVKPVVLTKNYRSGQEVLDASYRLIQHNNPNRLEVKLGIDKRLIAQKSGSNVSFTPYGQAGHELSAVALDIEGLIKAGHKPGTIAVLSATHTPLKRLAKGLRQQGVPFALSTQADIFEQPELKQLWHVLQWINFGATSQQLAHILMGPFCRLTAEQYRALNYAGDGLESLEESLRRQANISPDYQMVVARIDDWRDWAKELPISQLTYRLIFKTGLSESLIDQAKESQRIIRVFEDLERLLSQMQDYETVVMDPTLGGYLRVFPQPPQIEVTEPIGEETGVQLLTVHASKGLEFDHVFLIGCTERNWSIGVNSLGRTVPEDLRREKEQAPEHEYRRLMYVAATRAKQSLRLSAATQTASGNRQSLSRFVKELFENPLPEGPKPVKEDISPAGAAEKLRKVMPLTQYQPEDRLPFEKHDGWLELAVGALGAYDYCPYDFFLAHVLGIHQPYGPQLAFGNALHKAMQVYYEGKLRGERPEIGELITRLDEEWSDRGYPSAEAAEKQHSEAHKTLRAFLAREEAETSRTIQNSELPITLEIPEAKLRLKGRIDALFTTYSGLEVRDFKTGRKTDAEKLAKDAKDNFQLRTYALAVQMLHSEAPALVTLDYVVTGVEGSAKLSPLILKNHREHLTKLAARLRSRDFNPGTKRHECAKVTYYGTEEDI